MSSPRVVGIAGSLRDNSHTRVACQRALRAAEEAGGETDHLDLREVALPLFDASVGEADAGDAAELTRRVRAADSVILATPMYHGSYSSPLKTAIDYCGFDEFEGKTVGMLAVAGGSFPITALEHLRSVCRALDAWVLPHQAAVPKARNAIEDEEIVDDAIAERVDTLGHRVVQFANIEADPASFESEENVGGD
jgi:NAD(P)H-dependent FMN reductase